MKGIALVLGTVAMVGLAGCATEDYVRTQVSPLEQRLDKLEAAQNADRAAIKQADDKAQQALDAVKVYNQKVDDAAARAERAATAAEQAEQKAEKLFRLQQNK
ncbi:MAG TPA: hypothetical protein VJ550_12055 [Geomonas sp.]|nr:hypothetical protein [Geomonas sp.]